LVFGQQQLPVRGLLLALLLLAALPPSQAQRHYSRKPQVSIEQLSLTGLRPPASPFADCLETYDVTYEPLGRSFLGQQDPQLDLDLDLRRDPNLAAVRVRIRNHGFTLSKEPRRFRMESLQGKLYFSVTYYYEFETRVEHCSGALLYRENTSQTRRERVTYRFPREIRGYTTRAQLIDAWQRQQYSFSQWCEKETLERFYANVSRSLAHQFNYTPVQTICYIAWPEPYRPRRSRQQFDYDTEEYLLATMSLRSAVSALTYRDTAEAHRKLKKAIQIGRAHV